MGVSLPAEGGGIAMGASLKEKDAVMKSSTVETENVHNTVQVLLILLHTTKSHYTVCIATILFPLHGVGRVGC